MSTNASLSRTGFAALLLIVACADPSGGDGDSATTGSTSAASEDTGMMSPTAADSGTSTTTAETTATTMPPTLPTSDTAGDTGSDDDAASSSEDDDSGSSGDVDACPGLGRNECVADPLCTPIVCAPFEMTDVGGAAWCIAPDEFIGCRSADKACARVRTVACDGDDGPATVCPSPCIPQGWDICPPPMMGAMPCPA